MRQQKARSSISHSKHSVFLFSFEVCILKPITSERLIYESRIFVSACLLRHFTMPNSQSTLTTVLCGGLVNVAVNGGPPLQAKPVAGGPLYLVSPWDSSQYRQDLTTYSILYMLLIEQYCFVFLSSRSSSKENSW
jgi:hypothetical protein